MNAVPSIELTGLTHRFPEGAPALQDISLAIHESESVGLIGPNGAGKTTLLAYLSGALISKAVRIHGEPTTRASAARARALVGLVFQQPDDQLFMPTVGDDIAFGPLNQGFSREETQKRVLEASAAVGLAPELLKRQPHHLSGGERRLAALATVLAMRPKVLALDEPTNDLDPRARRALIQILKGLPTTRIVASHDLELILELCSRSVLLDAGRIVADGPTTTLLGNASLMQAHGLEVPLSIRLRQS